MDKYNVLIFPAGSENGLNIYESLKYNVHFNLFGASSIRDHAEYIYPSQHYFLGDYNINNPLFLEHFNEMIENNRIDFIIPTHDTVCLYLMRMEHKIKAKVVCSPLLTTEIAHSKKKMYETFKDTEFVPQLYQGKDVVFPLFLKPDIGAGGKRTALVQNQEELDQIIKENEDMVLCEYLPGEEYTVDCFTDRHRNLLFMGPRTRERVTMGIAFKSKSIPLDFEIEQIGKKLNDTLVFRGAWFFQLKRDKNGKLKLLEFSVRQSGTMALYRELGINFSSLSLFDFLDVDVKILKNPYQIELDRCLKNSFKIDYDYHYIYVDFDDTIIVNNKVNSKMIMFLYQAFNKGKNIILLTKHELDLHETLNQYRIYPDLFDRIIWLKAEERKSDFIEHQNAIFIDNYYKERIEVFNQHHIAVFDVDALDALVDDSEF